MASLYKRNRSPFWWIKWRDPQNPVFKDGKEIQRRESTGYRIGVSTDTRAAKELCAERTLAEVKSVGSGNRTAEKWDNWVPQYIQDCVKDGLITALTAERYNTAWRTLRIWLEEIQVEFPRQLTYHHCSGYIQWRAEPDKTIGKFRAGRNTAVLEFKLLRWLLRQAVRKNYCPSNPAREVTVKREPRRLFATYTVDQLKKLFDAIEKESEPRKTQFKRCLLIAWYHGVRENETNVNPMTDVRLWLDKRVMLGEITFRQKGQRVRTKPLHPKLIELFTELRKQKETHTYPPLEWKSRWSGLWFRLLTRCGLKRENPNLTFHSVRKTVQNTLRRAGIEREIVMEYLTHDQPDRNKVVHDDYTEIRMDEMRVCHKPLDVF